MSVHCSGFAIVASKIIELQKNTLNNITLDKHIQNCLENNMFQYNLKQLSNINLQSKVSHAVKYLLSC